MKTTQCRLLKRLKANRCRISLPGWAPLFALMIFLFFCSYSNLGFASPSTKDFQLSRRDKIFGIYPVSKHTCWAVGNNGLILKLTDTGTESKELRKGTPPAMEDMKLSEGMPPPPPGMDAEMMQQMMGGGMPEGMKLERMEKVTSLPLYDVFFITKRGWIVGGDGLILHTEDGGASWKQQPKITDAYLLKVLFLDEDRGFAVGESGAMLFTEDGGSQWQFCPFDWAAMIPEELAIEGVLAPTLYDLCFVDGSCGWIVGDNGVVMKTVDGGRNWELLRIGSFPPLFSVVFKDEFEGFAVGQNGLLLHSTDGGKSWVESGMPAASNLFTIRLQGNFGLIVGDEGTVLVSMNGGKNWGVAKIPLFPPFPYFSDAWLIANSAPKKLILLGEQIISVPLP